MSRSFDFYNLPSAKLQLSVSTAAEAASICSSLNRLFKRLSWVGASGVVTVWETGRTRLWLRRIISFESSQSTPSDLSETPLMSDQSDFFTSRFSRSMAGYILQLKQFLESAQWGRSYYEAKELESTCCCLATCCTFQKQRFSEPPLLGIPFWPPHNFGRI